MNKILTNFVSHFSVYRKKRMQLFLQLVGDVSQKKISILDIGGTADIWAESGLLDKKNVSIVILNMVEVKSTCKNVTCIIGDARRMENFPDKCFDFIFSNSVIEHVGNFTDQAMMANEVQRLGKEYFIQTPNYFFPFEPHFLCIGFQFLPLTVKVFCLRHFNLGYYSKVSNRKEALELANSVKLLKKSELKKLFPNATIVHEKITGLTKSFYIHSAVHPQNTVKVDM